MRPAAILAASLLAGALACSPDSGGEGGLGLVEHDRFFKVTGSHQAFGCEACHDPSASSFTMAGLLGDKPGMTCLGCHAEAATASAHTGVPGFAWASPSCVGCHRDGTQGGSLPASHDALLFPVTGTPHATLGCSACHPGGDRTLAAVTCIPCHAGSPMASAHARIPVVRGSRDGVTYASYAYASSSCLTCHADGQVDRIAAHPRTDGGFDNQRHPPGCLVCHQQKRTGARPWGQDFGRTSCLACHTSNNGGGD